MFQLQRVSDDTSHICMKIPYRIWYDIWYDALWYDMIWYVDMTWYSMIYHMIYDMMWCDMMSCDVMWCDIWYMISNIFVNCNSVDTRWQQYSTHLHTNSTQNDTKQTIHRKLKIWEECGPCPVFTSISLAFALQLRKKHGIPSVRVAEECQLARWKQNIQNRTYIKVRIHKHNNRNT